MRRTWLIVCVALLAIGSVAALRHGDKISLPPAFAALGLGKAKDDKAQATLEFVEREVVQPQR